MKNFYVAVALATFAVAPAFAADMPVKAPPKPVATGYSWAGWYIGLNAGGIWGSSTDAVDPSGCFVAAVAPCGAPPTNNPLRSDTGSLNRAGFIGGAQAGVNWQTDKWVYGLETDFQGTSLNSTDAVNRPVAAPLVGNFIHSVNEKLDWLGTFRGRLGVTVSPTWLLYATGGLAYGHVNSSTNV